VVGSTISSDFGYIYRSRGILIMSYSVKDAPYIGPILPQQWNYNTRFKCDCVIPFLNTHITIKQSPKGDRVGATVWDAAIVTCKYLELHYNYEKLAGKRVIELGSGVGLVGLAAALLGAKQVVLTDQKDMIEILRSNTLLNVRSSNVKVRELCWGADVRKFLPPYDMIIASDVIYEEHCIESLVKTISALSDANSTIIIGHERRGMAAEEQFYDLVSKEFDIYKEDGSRLHPTFYSSQITLCFLKKREFPTNE